MDTIEMLGVSSQDWGGNDIAPDFYYNKHGRPIMIVWAESGHACTEVDLVDLVYWIKDNNPEIFDLTSVIKAK